jgi:hypothetical protein
VVVTEPGCLAGALRSIAIALALTGLAASGIAWGRYRVPELESLAIEAGTVSCAGLVTPFRGRPSYVIRLEPRSEDRRWVVEAGCPMPPGIEDIEPGDRLEARISEAWAKRQAWQIERGGSVVVSYSDLVQVNTCFANRTLRIGLGCELAALVLGAAWLVMRRSAGTR